MDVLDPLAFRTAYSAFLVPGRILLNGHSHQAWPDLARDAQARYFDDSARFVDTKWEHAVFPAMNRVRQGILRRMGFPETDALAFGKSTHELVFRLLSCFRLGPGTRIVSTTAEFHSLHRQLLRLAEDGVELHLVDAQPRHSLADRLYDALVPGTTMLALSAVLFEDAYVMHRLPELLARAVERSIVPLIDAYHAFNVVPLPLGEAGRHAFVVAGGYKYAQFGEGICWLRLPDGTGLRPVYTGWFADFERLGDPRTAIVGYGEGGARFAGATFDGSAVYRAEGVLRHFDAFQLPVDRLRAISLRQTDRLIRRLDERGALEHAALVTPQDHGTRGGFLSLRTPHAAEIVVRLRQRNVWTDHRADLLRIGPAPYLSDAELDDGADAVAAELRR